VRPLIDPPRLVVLPGQVRSGLATLTGDAALCARPEMACRVPSENLRAYASNTK
jgi:hypothetical protein